jgi:hypothetical protein
LKPEIVISLFQSLPFHKFNLYRYSTVSPDGAQLHTAGEDTCLTTWTVATGDVVSKIFQGRISGKGKDAGGEVEEDGGKAGGGAEVGGCTSRMQL